MKGIGLIAIIVIIAFLLVAAGAAIYILNPLIFQGQGTTAPNIGNTSAPTQFVVQYPKGSTSNTSQITETIAEQLNASNVISISYSGYSMVSGISLLGGLSVTVPVNATFQRYYNSSRVDMVARTPIGDMNFDQIAINQSTSYTCTRGIAAFNIGNISFNTTYTCTKGNSSILSILSSPQALTSYINDLALPTNTTLQSSGERTYDGLQCVFFSGGGYSQTNRTLKYIGTIIGINYTLSTCISGVSGLPLNISSTILAYTSGSSKPIEAVTGIREISLGSNVTEAEVTSLPAPVT